MPRASPKRRSAVRGRRNKRAARAGGARGWREVMVCRWGGAPTSRAGGASERRERAARAGGAGGRARSERSDGRRRARSEGSSARAWGEGVESSGGMTERRARARSRARMQANGAEVASRSRSRSRRTRERASAAARVGGGSPELYPPSTSAVVDAEAADDAEAAPPPSAQPCEQRGAEKCKHLSRRAKNDCR